MLTVNFIFHIKVNKGDSDRLFNTNSYKVDLIKAMKNKL